MISEEIFLAVPWFILGGFVGYYLFEIVEILITAYKRSVAPVINSSYHWLKNNLFNYRNK